jgi:serine/threonine protein kinase
VKQDIVWRAFEPLLGRQVAVKVIRPGEMDSEVMRQRFMIEARAGAAIDHPNVVQVHAVGQVGDVLYIAMQLIGGPSLGEVLDRQTWVDAPRAVAIVCQIANALEVAHERGLVHRDVKPRNILLQTLGGTEHAYLADFGLARFVAASGLTRKGDSVGTPAYMAPEQVRGETVDGRADIYALGCVLFHALTGEVPFPKEETHAIYFAHLEGEPPRCSECNSLVDPAFDDVVMQAMAKNPEQRFASASDLARACTSALDRVAADPLAGFGEPDTWLVVQNESGPALIHRDGSCSVLAGSVEPPASIVFAGPGTAGWMTADQALGLVAGKPCWQCMRLVARTDGS